MAHDKLKELLSGDPGKLIVKSVTQSLYAWAEKVPVEYYNFRVFHELTVRYETSERTRLGLKKFDHFRFDSVFFVEPGYRALDQRQCYTIGIELKQSKSDLMGDKKMEKYLGWTDLFYIGVPADLTGEALEKAKEVNNEYIGVIDIENGLIIKNSKKMKVSERNRMLIYEQVLFNTVFREMGTISFDAEEVLIDHTNIETGDEVGASLQEPNKSEVKILAERIAKKEAEAARREAKAKEARELADRAANLAEPTRRVLSALPDKAQAAYHHLRENPGSNAHDLEEALSVSEATAKRLAGQLSDVGLIERQGSKKTGGYYPIGGDKDPMKYLAACADCELYKNAKKINSYAPLEKHVNGDESNKNL